MVCKTTLGDYYLQMKIMNYDYVLVGWGMMTPVKAKNKKCSSSPVSKHWWLN